MANQVVALDQENVWVRIRLLLDADGTPDEGVLAADAGHLIWYHRPLLAVVTDSASAADSSGLAAAHVDWEFSEIRDGYYWVAFPDAAFAAGAGSVQCCMSTTASSGIAETVTIEPLFKFQGSPSSVTSTTTTLPAGPVVLAGDSIYVPAGTGIGQTRLITSATGQVATHLAWTTNISDTTTTILLIAGDSHQVNLDAAITSRSSLTSGDLTTETTVITNLLPTSRSPAGNMRSNIEEVNDVTVTGVGTAGDPWNP